MRSRNRFVLCARNSAHALWKSTPPLPAASADENPGRPAATPGRPPPTGRASRICSRLRPSCAAYASAVARKASSPTALTRSSLSRWSFASFSESCRAASPSRLTAAEPPLMMSSRACKQDTNKSRQNKVKTQEVDTKKGRECGSRGGSRGDVGGWQTRGREGRGGMGEAGLGSGGGGGDGAARGGYGALPWRQA